MDAELSALERKLEELLHAHVELRGENSRLRQQLSDLRTEHAHLLERTAQAAQRLDAMLERLPAEDA
jgi:uncharacterized protein (TIGR02449 family)